MTRDAGHRQATILLVEDDLDVAETLRDIFEDNGYAVRHAESGSGARALADSEVPDLVFMDLRLPDQDGLILCADLHARMGAPIILCSGSQEKRDQILGFKLGADDYIAKPFDVDQVLARVEAALRRSTLRAAPAADGRQAAGSAAAAGAAAAARPSPPAPAPPANNTVLRVGALTLDRARHLVTLGSQPIQLTPTEHRLLVALMARVDEVLTRDELAQIVWGVADGAIGRSIDVHMRRLRAKLMAGPVAPPAITSVRGFGYRLSQEADSLATTAA